MIAEGFPKDKEIPFEPLSPSLGYIERLAWVLSKWRKIN